MTPSISYSHLGISWKLPVIRKGRTVMQQHQLRIGSGYPATLRAELLFRQFVLPYFISEALPAVVRTDFPVLPEIRAFVCAMYRYLERPKPEFEGPRAFGSVRSSSAKLDPDRAVIAFSGGKDGLYYALKAREKFGAKNILPVHLKHLSTEGVSHREYSAAANLSALIGVPLRIVEFINSSRIPGRHMMRFRDMFLIAMLAALAEEYGAGKIFIEGSTDANASLHPSFSDLDSSWERMRHILQKWGVCVEICSEPISEYEILHRMYRDALKRPYMPASHSCLRCDRLMIFCRDWYKKRMPTLYGKMYEGQCGSCFKCRMIILARFLWDPLVQSVPIDEKRTYIIRTKEWRERMELRFKDIKDFSRDPSLIRMIEEADAKFNA